MRPPHVGAVFVGRVGVEARSGWKTTNLQTRKLTLSVSSSSFIVGARASGNGWRPGMQVSMLAILMAERAEGRPDR